MPRKATVQRDDLEANALYLSDGETKLLLVSCDLVGLPSARVAVMREATGQAIGIPPRNIIVACTHTHGGPSLIRTNYLMPIDHAYLERLQTWLVELAREAARSARPGRAARRPAAETLLVTRDQAIRARVTRLLAGSDSEDRRKVLREYQSVLELTGAPANGQSADIDS